MSSEKFCGAAAVAAVCGLAFGVSASTPVDVMSADFAGAQDVRTLKPMERRFVEVNVASGPIVAQADANASGDRVLAYSTEISIDNGDWVRLEFGDVTLPGNLGDGTAAYMVITSAADGAYQILDAASVAEFANTSAYFNGDTVFVDVYVAPNSAPASVEISTARTNPPKLPLSGPVVKNTVLEPRSQCGPWDERTPTYDLRVARMQPIGCTGWQFNNRPNAMGSAGHCSPGSGDIMVFGPPLSNSSGSWQFPPPSMQYAVDGSSVRRVNGGIGNDWSVYGVFNNSTTGLNVMDAMLDSYPTVTGNAPAVNGQQIRITGFGSNSTPDPIPNEWDLALKTHTGPYVQVSGTRLRYAPDTSGGNSGSPVVDDSTGRIIGVHSHAGCSTSGGSNQGTAINNSGFRSALAGAQGIAQGNGGAVMWTPGGADGRPARIGTDGTQTIVVGLDADFTAAAPNANTFRLNFNSGDGFTAIAPSANLGNNLYQFTFPAASCDATAQYFFSVTAANGTTATWPPSAPGIAFDVEIKGEDILFDFDGENGSGWAVSGNASAGQFERGVPSTTGKGSPWLDADGSGACWLTGEDNQFDDVDGGATILTSPVMDIAGAAEPMLSFEYFHYASGNQDRLVAEVSDDGGATWTQILNSQATLGWTLHEVRIGDVVDINSQFRVRFNSSDTGSSSNVESAIDAVRVTDLSCAPENCNVADIAAPLGLIDIQDVDAFIGAFIANDPIADVAAPFGIVDIDDVDGFIAAFQAGCP